MSPERRSRDRILDIIEAIDQIHTFVNEMTEQEFCADPKTRLAVLSGFTIIGEASRHLPLDITAAHPEIPWVKIGDMRNVIVHVYFGVDPSRIWQTIRDHLPPLLNTCRAILEELDDAEQS